MGRFGRPIEANTKTGFGIGEENVNVLLVISEFLITVIFLMSGFRTLG